MSDIQFPRQRFKKDIAKWKRSRIILPLSFYGQSDVMFVIHAACLSESHIDHTETSIHIYLEQEERTLVC